jgi:hypothetical protein
MNALTRSAAALCGLLSVFEPLPAVESSRAASRTAAPARDVPATDGRRDFDFEIGTWKTRVRRLKRPLTGSTEWAEYEGTSVVTALSGGRANIVELDVAGPAGRIEGVSLRLYNPEARQWSLNFSNHAAGTLSPPVTGGFRNGRGEFYGIETLGGRTILVRFVISDVTAGSARFEQAFSDDGGRTWEANWIATDTRLRP